MKKLEFQVAIRAAACRVYDVMLGIGNKATYEQWTSEFNPTSTYEGSWEKGSKLFFIGTDENGKKGGMISEIAENIPGKFISIRHYGILDGDKEITEGPEIGQWAGSLENYSLEEKNGVTTVTVNVDVTDEYIEYFNTTWPNALNKLKSICE